MSRCILFCLTLLNAWFASAQVTFKHEPLGPSSRKTGLVISEIMYHPRVVTTIEESLEFIEIYNSNPWGENIGGYAIGGSVDYVFAPDTILPPKGFIVVARQPGFVMAHYGTTNVLGPWEDADTSRLPTTQGTVELRNRENALLLTVNYSDTVPWPVSPDGKGHSLVLARPSFGEDDVRAWAQSDRIDGSPGMADPVTREPIDSVVLNEWLAHTDAPLADAFELYNHGNEPVDLSGAWVTDDPDTNKFRIPDGTIIPPRGFLWWRADESFVFQLLSEGERIYLVNSNENRVIDAIDFRGQSNAVASGRSPDGGPYHYCLATRTLGAPNSQPLRFGVVINEIMFNPMSGELDDEYVEIYNRLSTPANLSAWEFVNGIGYLFPSNTVMPPNAYWVIARNPTNLMALYPNLTTNNTFGPYTGTLANGGERLTLTAADYGNFPIGGSNITLRLPVVASEVFYGDGGRWGNWADGSGSSLELIDAEADTQLAANWADSDTGSESKWTAVEYNGPFGESLGNQVNDAVIIMLQGLGECLVDEVEVRVDNGPNLVVNGGFENDLQGWDLQGSHDFSTVSTEAFAGNKSLHLRAASRGDNQSNRILSAPFGSPIAPTAGKVSIRVKARWLRGHPEILVRLHGSATEAYGTLALPRRLGTPAAPNSRRVANAGPAIYEVEHSPVLPVANQGVVVTARASDRTGITSFNLKYRVDPAPVYTSAPMMDNGTSGDAIANDGIFSATIPGQNDGTIVAFYLEARDTANAASTFPQDVFPPAGLTRCWPNDAVARECVVRFGEVQMPGDFATYHLWVTAANSNRWHHRDTMNNAPIDGTFIYNDSRIVYNALPLFSGSPWHRAQMTNGPAGANRVDYEMNFAEDDSLLGATDFILNNPGNPTLTTFSDLSAVAEHTVFKIFEDMRLPHNRRRYIHLFVNGSQRSSTEQRVGNFIFEDVQQPNSDMVEQFFGGGGQLFKVDDWFEFEPNGFDIHANNDADLLRRAVTIDGVTNLYAAPYRFMFRKRAIGAGSANDYSQIFALIDAASPPENPDSLTIDPVTFGAVADIEQWMRVFAIQRAVGNWDSYGWDRGKNDYLFRPAGGLFMHMPWDIDYSLGLGRPFDEPLFASNDPRVRAMFNTPAIARAYWRSLSELANGPFNNDNLDPFIDSRVNALIANGVNVDMSAVDMIKSYIWERQGYLLTQLASVDTPFAIDGASSLSSSSNLVVITGTAPVNVAEIVLNGLVYPVTWTTVTNFSVSLVVYPGFNQFNFQGQDRFGELIPGLLLAVDVTYTGPAADLSSIAISEIMHSPSTEGAQFIEIVNSSQMNFDLSFWRIDAVGYTFPIGSILGGGQTILLAQNKNAFLQSYGNVPLFGIFNGQLSPAGEAIALVRFSPEGNVVVDGLRYEAVAPWPVPVAGLSLQVIDATQDNSRVSNWAYGTPTPGTVNSVAATLPLFDSVWLNELQTETLIGPADSGGDRDPWIELFNGGSTPIDLSGYFLANNYSSNLTQWSFPVGASIAPGEYKLIWADGEPEESTASTWHTSFRLDYGGTLALVRPIDGQPQIADYLTFPSQGANVSYGNFPDGQPVFRSRLFHPTAGTTNLGHTIPLFVNEWLARNANGLRDPADNQLDDWFEIYNGGTEPVNLAGFYLTDEAGDPQKFRVPDNDLYIVPPRGYLLVWADDTPTQNGAGRELHARFRLGGGSGYIGITAPDGETLIDGISYGSQTNDITQGRFGDGASTIYYTAKPTPRGPNAIVGANTPPVFPVIPTQFAIPGQRLLIVARANDPQFPDQQTLSYTLLGGPPSIEINTSGLIRWIIPTNQMPADYPVTVRVTDSAVPPRSDTTSFIISVRASVTTTTLAPPPEIQTMSAPSGQATFTILTTAGHTYRVLYTDDLASTDPWQQLGRDFVAANPYASITDFITSPKRFYRVYLVE